MSKTITVIDTFGFFFRSYYALPPLSNSEGFPTGLLTGFVNFIDRLHKDHGSDYIVFALDAKGPTFRHEIDPNYKANRPAPPEELTMQLPVAIDWIEKMGFKSLTQAGFEADDMIATVTRLAREQGIRVRIVSHDKDLYQLIEDEKVVLVDAIKRIDIDEAACAAKYGIQPRQFTDYQAMLGDSADNVPGVKGVGKVTAQKLLNAYDTLDNIYAHLDIITPAGTQKKMREGKGSAERSRELVTLRDDVLDTLDFEAFAMQETNPFLAIVPELRQYEMNGILKKMKNILPKAENAAPPEPAVPFERHLVTDEAELTELLKDVTSETVIAFDTETTGLDYTKDTLVGFSFCLAQEKAYYVPLTHRYLGVPEQMDEAAARKAIAAIFKGRVVGHNIKFDLHFVQRFMPELEVGKIADTMLLAWMADTMDLLALDKLAQKYLNHPMISYKETVKKGEDFSTVALEDACNYAAEDAWVTFRLYRKLPQMLNLQSAPHMLDEAETVEYPFIQTLARMETAGIKTDESVLEAFLSEAQAKLAELTERIYTLCNGIEFNINSTRQLGEMLFETLNLPTVRKTKTGYSTDEKVLTSLKEEHPVIDRILEYRELHKLLSTYIEPLLQLSREQSDGRIHTSFVQTGTATGRLSSKNPNLQNIPTRTPLGARIREAFVAPEGRLLIGIDYSQIELRLLAHFSQDPTLMEAFRHDKDIHFQTAAALFGEADAAAKRPIAKTVNFGLLYGMGQKKLSETLGITTKEAKAIIGRYFDTFPTVKSYFAEIVDTSRSQGYVETLLRRRRYFDFASATPREKAAYERESVNTVFQGSAADLIKLAMLRIDALIREEALEAVMLLQIHDELIFEVDAAQADAYGKRFQETMQRVFELNVPLKASLNVGKHWGELK